MNTPALTLYVQRQPRMIETEIQHGHFINFTIQVLHVSELAVSSDVQMCQNVCSTTGYYHTEERGENVHSDPELCKNNQCLHSVSPTNRTPRLQQ